MNRTQSLSHVAGRHCGRPARVTLRGGFQLIELQVVIAIIAILAAILFPAIQLRARRNASYTSDTLMRTTSALAAFDKANGFFTTDPQALVLYGLLQSEADDMQTGATTTFGYQITLNFTTTELAATTTLSATSTVNADSVEVTAEPVDYDKALDRLKTKLTKADVQAGKTPAVVVEPKPEAYAYLELRKVDLLHKGIDAIKNTFGVDDATAKQALDDALANKELVNYVTKQLLDVDNGGDLTADELNSFSVQAYFESLGYPDEVAAAIGGNADVFIGQWSEAMGGDLPPLPTDWLLDALDDETALEIAIDVKPGEDARNPIHLGSKGVLPVAILGSADFDAATIDPSTAELVNPPSLASLPAEAKFLAEDVNGDGHMDLVVYFDVQGALAAGVIDALTTSLRIHAETYDGSRVTGEQPVQIVPRT